MSFSIQLFDGHMVVPMAGHVSRMDIAPCNACGDCVVRIKISLPESISQSTFRGPTAVLSACPLLSLWLLLLLLLALLLLVLILMLLLLLNT